MKSIKSDVNATKDTAVTIGLKIAFQETFRCKICLNNYDESSDYIFQVLQIAHWL